MKKLLMFVCAVIGIIQAPAQDKSSAGPKGVIYFGFGSHRTFYTHSDIHVKRRGGPAFDFVLYDVKAKDEGGLRFHTAPQFSYEGGYYFTKKKFGIEYHYDHIKYFVVPNQVVRFQGSIGTKSYSTDTALTADFFKFEHSDGGNYAMVNLVKWIPLLKNNTDRFGVSLTVKAGFGVVNPKTNSTILGVHRDDKYHISGFVTGLESGLRINFLKHLFVSGNFKGTYANYKQFLIANGYGHQKWFAGQFIYLLGAQFQVK